MQPILLHGLAKNWWLILLRGIVSILFGIAAISWPGLTLVTLVLLYAAFAFVDGVFALGAAVMGPQIAPRWWLVIVGLISIGFAIATYAHPKLTAILLVMLIGAWSVARGVMEIVGAIQLRKEIDNEWWLIAAGVISVLFGIAVLVAPGQGALAMILVIGVFAIVEGVMLVLLSLRLKRHAPAAA